jgi:hypothetical protein
MDDLDRAADIEQLERSASLARHAKRPRPIALCEMCEEAPVHVTALGTHWRYCVDCAEEHLRGGV